MWEAPRQYCMLRRTPADQPQVGPDKSCPQKMAALRVNKTKTNESTSSETSGGAPPLLAHAAALLPPLFAAEPGYCWCCSDHRLCACS
jgi:hypothetical protein